MDDVFGPLILANKLKWVFFALLLFFGLVFLALTVFFYVGYRKTNNTEPPEEANNTDGSRLLARDSKIGGTDSEAEFEDDKPNVVQQERVFNLHGQGKPVAEMDYSNSPGNSPGSERRDY